MGVGATALAMIAALAVATPSHASELRFRQTAAGSVVATGNTLGLSKELAANGPGIEDSIGTFITLDAASVDDVPLNVANPWGAGTTNDWTQNGSEAWLELPDQAEVLYAELVWGGSTDYVENVLAFLNDPVTLGYGGDSEIIDSDPLTDLDIAETAFSGFLANYYSRSAEVTDFVAMHGAGMYSVQGVPGTQASEINSLNAAGWTLLVAYRDSAQRIRNLTIFVGGSFVDEDTTEVYDFAGFCTPPSGEFEGRAVVSTIEGDADITGDSFEIGPSAGGPFVALSGPNNPSDNFFCSQLNDSSGNVDTAGTYGTVNQNAAGGFNVVGGRQGWDVTTIAVSSSEGHFGNDQTAAVLRAVTTGDSFVPIATGFAIEVNAPDFSSRGNGASATPTLLAVGDMSTLTVNMENAGLVDATDLLFTAPLPTGLDLVSFTLDGAPGDVNGAAVDAAGLTSGVEIGDVAVGQSRQIVIELVSTGAPAPGDTYVIQPGWEYDYVSCAGEPPLTEPHSTAPVVIDFEPSGADSGGLDDTAGDSGSGTAGASEGSASASGTGDSMGTGLTGFASMGQSAGTVDDTDGCGCRSERGLGGSAWWLWLLPVAIGRRRRRD